MMHRKKEAGLTLLELIIAMTIGLVLTAGIGQFYISNKQTYRTVEGVSRLQENGRFALNFMINSIREADHMGCLHRNNSVFSGLAAANNISVVGLVDSDSITLTSASQVPMNVNGSIGIGSSIALDNADGFEVGDLILVSDCEKGQTASITAIVGDTLTIASALTQPFSNHSNVSKLITSTYSLGINGAGNPALFMSDGLNNLELVEGVEDMQILFGVDSNSDVNSVADYYVDSSQVPDMNDVVSIKITLTVRTLENAALRSRVYDGVTDRRVVKNYSATVAIRNRLY